MGSSAPGRTSPSFSGLSRCASTRIAALSTVRVRLRSARPFTEAKRSSSDRYRSSSGRENHSDDTRSTFVPRDTSTLVAAAGVTPGIDNLGIHGFSPATGGRKPLSRPPNPSRTGTAPLSLSGSLGCEVAHSQEARAAKPVQRLRADMGEAIAASSNPCGRSSSETCSMAKPASNRRLVPSWRKS